MGSCTIRTCRDTFRRFGMICWLAGLISLAAVADDGWLTDAEVSAVLEQGSAGVFYAWSPHMPLSVDGLAEIALAGERLGITVVPLLSSHANLAYARDRTDGMELPERAYRRSASVMLEEQDLNVHAPAILIFAGGRFVSPVIPGFRNAADYEALIERFLASARQ